MKHELSTELSDQMCIIIRGGIKIWIPKEKAEILMQAIEKNEVQRFVRINDQFLNIADIQGIFPYNLLKEQEDEENEKEDSQYWTCSNNARHNKREFCRCFE